ncbi:MAG: sigma 54-interacting transcriptional regulator, partial [Firmicutes bacterium]|nr:sigma 54-interacting transcriptional regulator [Bacillota bacterium]
SKILSGGGIMLKEVQVSNNLTVGLKNILDSSFNGVVMINNRGIIQFFNHTAEKYFGYPSEHAIGRLIKEVIPGCELLQVLKTKKPLLAQERELKGSVYLVNEAPILIGGEIIAAVGFWHDITYTRNITVELEEVKQLHGMLEAVLENCCHGIVTVDTSGIITMINKAYESFLNVKAEDVIGQHVTKIIQNTRLHIVAKTGQAELGEFQKVNNTDAIVSRIPIYQNGKVVAAIGQILFRDLDDLKTLANKVYKLHEEVAYYKGKLKQLLSAKYNLDDIIGNCESIQSLKTNVCKLAKSNSTVLIVGESGTGKELIAHAIHNKSNRSNGPFVKVNCASIPDSLMESELFGYSDGAFTGAKKGGRQGKFELANGGTIFLDEIGDMQVAMQAKLLRVLQEKEIERIGEGSSQQIDVRVIAATNRNLMELITKGAFREDLFYRINVVTIRVPALRDRKDDIEIIVKYFVRKFNKEFGVCVEEVSEEVLKILYKYDWPGNVRELGHILERAYNIMDSNIILPRHLPIYFQNTLSEKTYGGPGTLKHRLEETEKQAITEALTETKGNKRKAANILGISRTVLYEKINKFSHK